MFKKQFLLVCCVIMAAALAACGGTTQTPETTTSSPTASTILPETTTVQSITTTTQITTTIIQPVSTITQMVTTSASPVIPATSSTTQPPASTTTPAAGEQESGYIVDREMVLLDTQIEVYHFTYMSDGLKVKGYLAQPKAQGVYPAIIYNRGGNLEFGALTVNTLQYFARMGFVTIGSQYRGNDGGEGREEFGGADINDVMNLIPILKDMPNVNPQKIGMVGYSRGGMMTYLALKEQTIRGTIDIKAACTVGGAADLFINGENRPEMVSGVFIPLIGGTAAQLPEEFKARSATYWPEKINTPLLLQHGEDDWRVLVEESQKLAQGLEANGKVYKLITYPGDDHSLAKHNQGLYEIFAWLAEKLDVSVNLTSIAKETPQNITEAEPGEIIGNEFVDTDKLYKVSYIPAGWMVNIPSSPLDIIVMDSGKGVWMGTGAFGGATYTKSFFEGVNAWWVPAITKNSTDVTVISEENLVIAGCQVNAVTFQHTMNSTKYKETTYHIYHPSGDYQLYRIRVTAPAAVFDTYREKFEQFVASFSFLE